MREIVPYVVLLVGLSLTAVVWLLSNNSNQASAQERYQYRTAQILTAITKRMEDYATVLRGGAALFAASGQVTREEWRAYIEHLGVGDTFPGFQGVGFSQYIKLAELAQHIQQIRAEGFPEYTVRPEGERAEYTSIIYLEPFDARNQRAFGYDMFSEPVRRAAMERARDTDTAAISGKVTLVQETEQDVQAGFLMYVPVYTHDQPHSSVEPRRTLQGYVYSPFRIRNLIQGIFPATLDDIDFEIFDSTEVVSSTLMYDSDESGHALGRKYTPLFSSQKIIDLYGHQWTLVFATRPPFESAAEQFQPWGILAAGIIISLLAFLFVRAQENTRERALALAHEMTSALRKREEELRTSEAMWHGLVNANPESVFLMDTTGLILAANETVAQRLGRDAREMIGADIFALLPPEPADRRKARVDEVVASGKPVRFEDTRGGRFIDNYIHPIFDSDGTLTRLAVLGIDITERKRAEEVLRENEQRLSSIYDTVGDVIFHLAVETEGQYRFISVNPSFCRVTGLSQERVVGKTVTEVIPEPSLSMVLGRYRQAIEAKTIVRWEETSDYPTGRLTGEVNVAPVFDDKGKCTHLVGSVHDITERKRAEEKIRELNRELEQRVIERTVQLEAARDEANRASRAKSEFLANMSHELRTPLNSILGFSEVLQDQTFGPLNEKQGRYVGNVLQSGRHLLQLINDVLDLSKVEAGKMELVKSQFPVAAALEGSLAMLRVAASKKNLRMQLAVSPEVSTVNADEVRFKQIMYNLLSNAVKFTPEGGMVSVQSSVISSQGLKEHYPNHADGALSTGHWLLITVKDTGIGIAPENMDRIWQEFEQVERAYSRRYQGTGLGLSLTKRLVELHGGQIWAESAGVGKGSTFTFTLPL